MKKIIFLFSTIIVLLFLVACNSEGIEREGNANNAIQIDYDKNALFNKYEIRVSVNNNYLGTQKQDTKKTYWTFLNSGNNILTISEVGNNNNELTVDFDAREGNVYYFFVQAGMSGIRIGKTDVKPIASVSTISEDSPYSMLGLLFIVLVCVIGVSVVPKFLNRRKTLSKSKKETDMNNVLSAITVSNILSFDGISSSCNISRKDVIRLLEEGIKMANSLPVKKQNSSSPKERFRNLRNARIDHSNEVIVLDSNVIDMLVTPTSSAVRHDVVDNAVSKKDNIIENDIERNENEIDFSDIDGLIISDNHNNELVLSRPDVMRYSNRRYQEVIMHGGSAIGQAIPALAQVQTMGEIARIAQNRLFTTSATISDLMKYSDGTFSSITRNGNKFSTHQGFTEVLANKVNPVAVLGIAMQAMAMISGQYYMHQISKQLKSVDKKLNKLIGYHHDEKIGKLRNINQELTNIVSKKNVDANDIISCQNMYKQCGEIFFEYFTRFEGVNIDADRRLIFKYNELKELSDNIDESELFFSAQMCSHARGLRDKCRLAEIAVRMKLGGDQERFILEQIDILKRSRDENFHSNAINHVKKVLKPVQAKAKNLAASNKMPSLLGDVNQIVQKIENTRKVILKSINEDEKADEIIDEVITYFVMPKEMLIMVGDTADSNKVFIRDNSLQ